jgi:hypothetical protein
VAEVIRKFCGILEDTSRVDQLNDLLARVGLRR